MYYLNEISKSESLTMSGGSRFLQFGSGVLFSIGLVYVVYYLLHYIKPNDEKLKLNTELRKLNAKMKRAKPLSQYPPDFPSWWKGKQWRPSTTGWFGYDQDELDDFIDLNVDKYLSSEPKLENEMDENIIEMDEDIKKMQQGKKPTSKIFLKSEELWNPKGMFKKSYHDDTKTTYLPENPTYRDAFVKSKVDEYLALETALLANKRDKKTSSAVFNVFRDY
jgi:hypothetical protein